MDDNSQPRSVQMKDSRKKEKKEGEVMQSEQQKEGQSKAQEPVTLVCYAILRTVKKLSD
jgi:hypothetical protein